VAEVLAALGTRTSLAVLTNKPLAATRSILAGLDLARFFDEEAIVGGDGPLPRKPDPAGLQRLMSRARATPSTTLLVGDSLGNVVQGQETTLPVTLELTLLSVAFALALGMAAGVLSAIQRDRAVDQLARVGALFGLSIPVFWQGTMLILFFSLYLRWMPPIVWVGFFTDPKRNLTIMLLPVLCLGTASAANIARTTRACPATSRRSRPTRTSRRGRSRPGWWARVT